LGRDKIVLLSSVDSVRGLVAEANFRLVRYGLPKVDISMASSGDKRTAATTMYQPEKQLEELRSLQVDGAAFEIVNVMDH
jgi:hypothetical protein